MKNQETDLNSLLQGWCVTSALPPRFREQVWKRIERAEVPAISGADALRGWFAMLFARPAFAVAYVSLLLIAGLTVGFVQANQKAAHWERHLEGRYVQSVDPYQRGP
jgi:hypothetical protein